MRWVWLGVLVGCTPTGDPSDSGTEDSAEPRLCGPEYMGEWEQLPPMISHRSRFGAAVVGNKLVVAGGYDGINVKDTVLVGTLDEDGLPVEWTIGPPLPEAREQLAVAVADGKVLALGGTPGGSTPSDDMWTATFTSSGSMTAWQPSIPLPEGLAGVRAVGVDREVWLVGGRTAAGVTPGVWHAEPGVVWATGTELPQASSHVGLALLDDQLWAIGGMGASQGLDQALVGPEWEAQPALGERIVGPGVAAAEGMVLVVGGLIDGTVPLELAWLGVPGAEGLDEWTELPPLPETRLDHAVVATEKYFLVIGGKKRTGENPQSSVFALRYCL